MLLSIQVREKPSLSELSSVQIAIKEAEAALGEEGRVLVRYSGTENKVRVLVETPDHADAKRWADLIGNALIKEIGG